MCYRTNFVVTDWQNNYYEVNFSSGLKLQMAFYNIIKVITSTRTTNYLYYLQEVFRNGGKCWPVTGVELPAPSHDLVNRVRAMSRSWQSGPVLNHESDDVIVRVILRRRRNSCDSVPRLFELPWTAASFVLSTVCRKWG